MSLTSVFASFHSYRSSTYVQQNPSAEGGEKNSKVGGERDTVSISHTHSSSFTYTSRLAQSADALAGSEERTVAANNILSFIGARLKMDVAEGASQEELMSRLEAGLKGFVQGYQEAYSQLAGMGFLSADVEEAIEKTYSDVLQGIDALAEELGIATPNTAELREGQNVRREQYQEPVPDQTEVSALAALDALDAPVVENLELKNVAQLIQAASVNYSKQESRLFDFSLTTKEGDVVKIQAALASVSLLDGESVRTQHGEEHSVNKQFFAQSGFYLNVEGDLSDEELSAIDDLLSQIKTVSDTFFAGDIEQAFEYALELGYDSEQISSFSLHLQYAQTTRVEQAYSQPTATEGEHAGGPMFEPISIDGFRSDDKLQQLARFVEMLEDLRHKADVLGLGGFAANDSASIEGPESILNTLLGQLEVLAESQSAV